MGVDFTAILDHRLSWEELCSVPTSLNAGWTTPPSLSALVAGYPKAGTAWRWRLSPTFSTISEELFDEGNVRLEGPACFGGWVFKPALEVTSLARWWSFLFDPDVRAGLLEGVRQIATILRSSTIIYLPDSAYPPSGASDLLQSGAGLPQVLSWLRTNVGEESPSIDAIRGPDEDHVDEAGYVVERLASAV